MRTKLYDVSNYLSLSSLDLLLLSETWLCGDILSNEFCPDSFVAYRSDRQFDVLNVTRGGGVMICAKSNLRSAPLDLSSFSLCDPGIDIVGIQIFRGHGRKTYVFAVYVPPSISVQSLNDFLEIFCELEYLSEGVVVVVGDFNVPAFGLNDMLNRSVASLNNFSQFLNLRQYNTVVNGGGRLLDLVFANMYCLVVKDVDPVVPEDIHHPALFFRITCSDLPCEGYKGSSGAAAYNFKRANYPQLYNAILETDWSSLDDMRDVNGRCDELYRLLYAAFDKTVPKTGVGRNSGRVWPSWFTFEIKEVIRKKETALRNFRKFGEISFRCEFSRYRALSKRLLNSAYRAYTADVSASLRDNPKSFWNHVQSRRGGTRIPGLMKYDGVELQSGQEIVDGFARYFGSVYRLSVSSDLPDFDRPYGSSFVVESITLSEVEDALRDMKSACTAGVDEVPSFLLRDCAVVFAGPLHGLFNLMLERSTFPTIWKKSFICPILKKGNPSDIKNYRPISLLCNFSKVLESILYKRIYFHVSCQLSSSQHGFMRGRSTVTNLAIFTQYVSDALDARRQVDVVYLDFQKAFDQLDHYILLQKMKYYGFCRPLLLLMESYLIGREQRVKYRNFLSLPLCPSSGVPQGSNLGPLLFLIFIDDIVECVGCETLLFADDLKLFSTVDTLDDCSNVQRSLSRIEDWCHRFRLSLNSEKSFYMRYTLRTDVLIGAYEVDGVRLRLENTCIDLGVRFDTKLTFRQHIFELIAKCYKTFGFVYRNAKDLSTECITALFFALIRSRLEYAAMVWDPIYMVHINSIESVQRSFLKYLSFRLDGVYPRRGSDYSNLLERFHFRSLEVRRAVITTKFVYKLLNGTIDCSHLLQSLNFNVPRSSARLAPTFYDDHSRTNVRSRSPVALMSRRCNEIAAFCDLFFDPVSKIISSTLLHSEVLHR